VSIIEVLLNASHESSGGGSSGLLFSLFFRSSALGDTSLVLKSEFSLGSVVFSGLLFHSSNGGRVGV